MALIEDIESKLNGIMIQDEDPFVVETCKNIYRALLVVAENEKPKIDDITKVLEDDNLTIYLLKKFDYLNKEVYQGLLNYIILDLSNDETLKVLINLIRKSINNNYETNQLDNNNENNTLKIKKTSHKLIGKKEYTEAEYLNARKMLEERSLFEISSWWGEGAYGGHSIIITKDKELYDLFSNIEFIHFENKKVEEHKIEKYDPLTDEEFKKLINIINDLLNAPEEDNLIFDAGWSINIDYNGTKKKFNNMNDKDKYQRIQSAVNELFEK